MTAAMAFIQHSSALNGVHNTLALEQDPFTVNNNIHASPHFSASQSWQTNSPSQLRRTLEAHLLETERRLQDAQKLGNSLLRQQSELTDKLQEVDQLQDETAISPELRKRLAELEKEHNDVGKEIARALLGPKSRVVSVEEGQSPEKSTFTSQATGSPTKISAPSRRQRNQPASKAGDLQFAADISTSLLAQVRQLQAAVAERDDLLKGANLERNKLEHESTALSQRLRMFDENEQRYKDENWNLETRNHDLLSAAASAAEREKKLNINLAAALTAKTRALNETDDVRLAHQKLLDEHAASKKSHDSELHTLRRTMESGDSDRALLQSKIDEVTAQNEEFARAFAARFRDQQADTDSATRNLQDDNMNGLSTPEPSPPPSPTKATPRHGGLESETLRSSLHHAHRMIQNLKNNIHREKTEKIELKRMLQDARDELEQRRSDSNTSTAPKRQKTKTDTFKKPAKPDMLGSARRPRTDVELEDDDWEENVGESINYPAGGKRIAVPGAYSETRITDVSDAYNTANETEGAFETADERRGTESEDFQTGAESMAGDSTDDLTETEDISVRGNRASVVRINKPSLAFKPASDRTSFMSTASTSADEEDDLRTPIQIAPTKFRLKNGRQSLGQSVVSHSTPTSFHSQTTVRSSPAITVHEQSPAAAEQSLFAELGGFEELGSDRFGTPGRSSIASIGSSPVADYTPDTRRVTQQYRPLNAVSRVMVDAGTMTGDDMPLPKTTSAIYELMSDEPIEGTYRDSLQSVSNFPLPPSVPVTPVRKADNGTQYTPQRSMLDSPVRNQAKFNTPPRTVWDEEQDLDTTTQDPAGNLGYSGLLLHDTQPISPVRYRSQTPPVPISSFSSIKSIDTKPVSAPERANVSTMPTKDSSPGALAAGAVGGGVLATAAAALGLSSVMKHREPSPRSDQRVAAPLASSQEHVQTNMPLHPQLEHAASAQTETSSQSTENLRPRIPVAFSGNDQGCQTMLSGQDILQALRKKSSRDVFGSSRPLGVSSMVSYPNVPTTPTDAPEVPFKLLSRDLDSADNISTPRSFSPVMAVESDNDKHRVSTASSQHPPLPADHKAAIAKASNKTPPVQKEIANSSHVSTLMGPPALPASAMRRPRTPGNSSVKSVIRDGRVAGPSQMDRQARGTVNSQMSRRSSVSSFASEVEERFNISANGQAGAHGFETTSGADPRMIQAITQTMIGEFLWKYTRKPGRSELSETRHRRYFWVHPYTKTLYWSSQDPQTAGKNEIKAKSVAIESVRVVPDDNPMPPGIYRKSLEVVTPGRIVRFTAATGQRHETWFNALSYLLNNGADPTNDAYLTGNGEITRDDIEEFRVQGASHNPTLAPPESRQSMSSYNSRTTRGTTNQTSQRQAGPSGIASSGTVNRNTSASATNRVATNGDTVRQSQHDHARDNDQNRTLRANSISRFSRMVSSVTGRTPRQSDHQKGVAHNENGSIYDASIVSDSRKDSAEELRQEMLRQEREGLGGLENVRACCDGKHDVSTLTRHPSASIGHHHTSRHLSIGRRSTSRRT